MTLKPMTIRKGDLVWWRGSFGTDGWKQTKVVNIDKCPDGGKYGDPYPWPRRVVACST